MLIKCVLAVNDFGFLVLLPLTIVQNCTLCILHCGVYYTMHIHFIWKSFSFRGARIPNACKSLPFRLFMRCTHTLFRGKLVDRPWNICRSTFEYQATVQYLQVLSIEQIGLFHILNKFEMNYVQYTTGPEID